MTIDPQVVYAVVRDGKVVAVRLESGVAEACANLEKQIYIHEKIEVVPVVITEVAENDTIS